MNQLHSPHRSEPSDLVFIGGLFYVIPTVACAAVAKYLSTSSEIWQLVVAVILSVCYGLCVGLCLVDFAKDHQAKWVSPALGIGMTVLCLLVGRLVLEYPHLGVLGVGLIIPLVWRLRSLARSVF